MRGLMEKQHEDFHYSERHGEYRVGRPLLFEDTACKDQSDRKAARPSTVATFPSAKDGNVTSHHMC